MGALNALAYGLLVITFATTARAQEPEYPTGPTYGWHPQQPPAGTVVSLSIQSAEKKTHFEVQRASDLVPLAKCDDACRMLLPVGHYRLVVHGSDGIASGRRTFELRAPSQMLIEPDAPAQRWVGLTMAVVGTVATFAGIALALTRSCSLAGSGECSTPFRGSQEVGVGLMLGGIGIMVPGWVMFGRSFRPGLAIREAE